MVAVSCSPRSPVTRHGDHSRWTGEPGLERGSANPELAIALIRQLARTGAGEGGGDQAGRLPGAPAGATGARSRSTTSSSAPKAARTRWIVATLISITLRPDRLHMIPCQPKETFDKPPGWVLPTHSAGPCPYLLEHVVS